MTVGGEGVDARVVDEHVVVIGAGPAGLAAAWAIRRAGVDPLVVDQADSVSASWRQRHDHLRLNTHRMFSHQPGARIPRRCGPFPGRDDYAAAMAGLDVLVVGPGNSGVDLLGHLAGSDAGKLWLSARSGMTITPRRLGGVPLHPVSVLGRYLPLRWQDANARAVQQLAFGDLTRLGYPRPALGAFTRAAADGVTIAVDDGFVRALKSGRVIMKPAIDRFDGGQVCFTDGTSCAPDAIICATGYRPGLEQIAGHLVTLDAHGLPPFTGASSSPLHPGLWFFGLDRSIYGNMHVRRRQARQLARAILDSGQS